MTAAILIVGLVIGPTVGLVGCGSSAGLLGLEDYQRDLLFAAGSLAISLLSNPVSDTSSDGSGTGEPREAPDGDGAGQGVGVFVLGCWDLNGNGVGDPEEDLNGDFVFDVLDCQGGDGIDGTDGADGLECWDLNGNRVGDPEEDRNGDLVVDTLDCQGVDGIAGTDGADGLPCWDLNGNGAGDPEEDVNGDAIFDARDCQGEAGAAGPSGAAGLNGLNCWDLNGNGVGDPVEDLNGDLVVDALDCQGAAGIDGADGVDGDDGADGLNGRDGDDGLNCWDTNGNGIGDPAEDANGDLVFDALDCQGAPGAQGSSGSPLFDTFIDQFFTLADGAYDSLPAGTVALPTVAAEAPGLGTCADESLQVVAYRTAIPRRYHAGYPVTMTLFLWRTGPKKTDDIIFRLDAYRTGHGLGVAPYGSPRYIKLDGSASPPPEGTMLVVELPLNNVDDDLASGLLFPNDLLPLDFLAVELNIVNGTDDGGCYTLLGVEFFESEPTDTVQVVHATVYKEIDDLPLPTSDCNGNDIPDEQDIGLGLANNGFLICHDPPGNPGHPRTIAVDLSILNAHLAHGDALGACSADCNGNAVPDECEPDCNGDGVPDDCDGGCGTTSAVSASGAPGAIEYHTPEAGATIEADVYVSATVSDADGLASIAWLVDGETLVALPLSGAFSGVSFLWRTTGAWPGTHTVTALVTDVTGQTTSSSIEVVKE